MSIPKYMQSLIDYADEMLIYIPSPSSTCYFFDYKNRSIDTKNWMQFPIPKPGSDEIAAKLSGRKRLLGLGRNTVYPIEISGVISVMPLLSGSDRRVVESETTALGQTEFRYAKKRTKGKASGCRPRTLPHPPAPSRTLPRPPIPAAQSHIRTHRAHPALNHQFPSPSSRRTLLLRYTTHCPRRSINQLVPFQIAIDRRCETPPCSHLRLADFVVKCRCASALDHAIAR